MLFDIPAVSPISNTQTVAFSNKRCRDCKHCENLNYHSDRYWYCVITPSRRTPYGVKAVKRMNNACERFEIK